MASETTTMSDEGTTTAINSPLPSPTTNDTTTTTTNNNRHHNNDTKSYNYTGRKPKWWKTLAGRRGTKSQRAAISRMTVLGYVIPKLDRYQHILKVSSELFGVPPRGIALTADRLLASPRCVVVVDGGGEDGGLSTKRDDDGTNEVTDDPTSTTSSTSTTTTNTSLEIGFGSGDNLLTNARNYPTRNFIGAEIHQPGVGIALGRMETAITTATALRQGGDYDVERRCYWDEQTWWKPPQQQQQQLDDHSDVAVAAVDPPKDGNHNNTPLPPPPSSDLRMPYDNIRIYPGDGIKLLQFLPPSSLDSIYLTHPDPWPRPGQTHWRVIQKDTIREMGRILKHGGCFYLATDAECFDGWTREVFGLMMNVAMTIEKNEEEDSGGMTGVNQVVGDNGDGRWEEVLPCPDRRGWLPVVSKYEEKGIDEGRETMVQCWRLSKAFNNI